MKENMGMKGKNQGDMSPKVEDMECKSNSQHDFSKTTEYVERRKAFEMKNNKDINKQAYKGRYS